MRVTVEKEWDHISQRRYRCIHETTLGTVTFRVVFNEKLGYNDIVVKNL